MILGKVTGTVWATRKDVRLQRYKLLLIQPYFYYNPAHDVEHLVAVDMVDAGVGDDVVVCLGAPARWSLGSVNLPVDAAVMGVVDRCQLQSDAFVQGGEGRGEGEGEGEGGQGQGPGQGQGRLRFLGGKEPKGVDWI